MFNLNWGVIGAGGISKTVMTDFLMPGATRGTSDVSHKVVAVAARDLSRAEKFVKDVVGVEPGTECKAYGSYKELTEDAKVDCVYIGTTHPEHFAPAKLALEAGKHVLCEKPFTVTSAQTEELLTLAKAKGVFIMEAVWTRFMPLVKEVEAHVRAGKIGEITRIYADLAMDFKIKEKELTHRLISPDLAGGGLLDLGPYPTLYPLLLLSPNGEAPSSIQSSIQFTDLKGLKTQVDAQTTFILNYNDRNAQAILTTSMTTPSNKERCVLIQGTKGEIAISGPAYRPEGYTLTPTEGEAQSVKADIPGMGYHWMGDEVARSIRDGKTEHERVSWNTTRLEMKIFDEVRKQNNFILPMDH